MLQESGETAIGLAWLLSEHSTLTPTLHTVTQICSQSFTSRMPVLSYKKSRSSKLHAILQCQTLSACPLTANYGMSPVITVRAATTRRFRHVEQLCLPLLNLTCVAQRPGCGGDEHLNISHGLAGVSFLLGTGGDDIHAVEV